MSFFRKRSIGTGINVGIKNCYLNILEIMECPEENVIEDDYQEEV